jgi:hypothetical protein
VFVFFSLFLLFFLSVLLLFFLGGVGCCVAVCVCVCVCVNIDLEVITMYKFTTNVIYSSVVCMVILPDVDFPGLHILHVTKYVRVLSPVGIRVKICRSDD